MKKPNKKIVHLEKSGSGKPSKSHSPKSGYESFENIDEFIMSESTLAVLELFEPPRNE
jgi:hypothetical protein